MNHNQTNEKDKPKLRTDRANRTPLSSLTKSLERSRRTIEQSLGIDSRRKSAQRDAESPAPNPQTKRNRLVKPDVAQQAITLDIPKALRRASNSTGLNARPDGLPAAAPPSLPKFSLRPQVKLDKPPAVTSTVKQADLRPPVSEMTLAIAKFVPPSFAPRNSETAKAFIAPATSAPTPATPANLVQRVLGVISSNTSLIPGQPQPVDNPLGWVVLAWARRQFQKTPLGHVLLNSAPESTTPVEMDGNAITIDATDADADKLTYTVTQPANGTVVQSPDDPSTFTYTGDGNESFTVTVSDAASGFHFHGLQGLFAPDGGHTKTVVVNVTEQEVHSTPPTVTEIDIDPGPDYTKTGSPFVGTNNTAVQYASRIDTETGQETYALAVRGSDGNTKVVDLEGKPVDGQNPLITDTTVIQNIQRTDGTYAMVIVPTATQTVAPQARGAVSPAMFSALDAPQDSYTVNLDGVPAGYTIAGENGVVYQAIDPDVSDNGSNLPGQLCVNCRIAVVDTTRVGEAGYTPDVVDIPGTITPGFATIGGTKYSALSVDGDGNLYVVASESGSSKVWVVDPATVDPALADDGATVITLDGQASSLQPVAFGPDGVGYIGTVSPAGSGQMEIIDPATRSVTDTVPLPEGLPGFIAFANGNVYQQAYAVDYSDPDHPTARTIMWVIPQGGGTPQKITFEGDGNFPYGWPVAAADGTVYQTLIAMDADNAVRTGIIKPGATTPVVVDLGSGYPVGTYQMGVVTGGTQTYQVVSSLNDTDNTGQTKVFRLSDADPDQTNHPLQPVATIDEHSSLAAAVAAPDGTLYFATQNPDGDYTVWSLAPGSDTPAGTAFSGNGDPTAFEPTADGHVYMTTTNSDGTQTWVYAVDGDDSISA
ncbi:hypothetical protein VST63_16110 [Mycolicibacterium sp. 050232]|uniref:hypothetical protein n=1 Tax=Mycolicibacterium sp. 050232 TaxID=3113982 RepID=UPI002E2AE3A4|nr:hypothetical protein [Mycolicibacterium sp. 050232]MED5813884.1 hypothetical protein [Mycolicibacterium sp. 050232]